jgi:hypothetical protein
MHELALVHGEDPLAAALIPLAVDGTIVGASMSLLLASRYGSRGGFLPWALLIVSSLAKPWRERRRCRAYADRPVDRGVAKLRSDRGVRDADEPDPPLCRAAGTR